MSARERNEALRAELDGLRDASGARSIDLGVAYFDLVATPLGSIANAKRWAAANHIAYAEVRTRAGRRGAVSVIVRASDVVGMTITYADIAPRGEVIAACADPSQIFFFEVRK